MSQSDFLSVGGGVTGLNGSRRISGEGEGLLRFVVRGTWPRFRGALLGSEKCDRPTRQFEVRENRQRHRDELRVKAGGGAAGKAKSNFGKTMGPLSGGGANAIDIICLSALQPLLSFTCMISTFGEKSKTRHEIDSRSSKCSVDQGAD